MESLILLATEPSALDTYGPMGLLSAVILGVGAFLAKFIPGLMKDFRDELRQERESRDKLLDSERTAREAEAKLNRESQDKLSDAIQELAVWAKSRPCLQTNNGKEHRP